VPHELVEALGPELYEAHKVALDTANQHVAHRVSDFSQVSVSLIVENYPPHPPKAVNVAVLSAFLIGPPPGQVTNLAKIAGQFQVTLAEQFDQKKTELLAVTNQGDTTRFLSPGDNEETSEHSRV
jgi:hypothetical protein